MDKAIEAKAFMSRLTVQSNLFITISSNRIVHTSLLLFSFADRLYLHLMDAVNI